MLLEIANTLQESKIEYLENISLKTRTWIHRGPIVPLYVIPKTILELERCIVILHHYKAKYNVVGYTSNLYFMNSYKVDAIVTTVKLTKVDFKEDIIECDTGVNISQLSKQCVEKGYLGFEGLVGLPGTVGAAFVNNSSCFKCSVSKITKYATALIIQESGSLEKAIITADDMHFSHRSSAIKRGELKAILLTIGLKIQKTGNIEELKSIMSSNLKHRKTTQEGPANNLGSVFTRRDARPLGLMDLGIARFPYVLLYRVCDHFFRNNNIYRLKRNTLLLRLYGYKDVIPYVSPKNINCFLWLDDRADTAFLRYQDFMHKCFDCGNIEIEIYS